MHTCTMILNFYFVTKSPEDLLKKNTNKCKRNNAAMIRSLNSPHRKIKEKILKCPILAPAKSSSES